MDSTVWILAGEASGDLYGARLARELRALRPGLVVKGMGGQAMRAEGVEILVDSTELGVVGFVEVLRHLLLFWRVFHGLLVQVAAERPAAVVLIDYPGFNVRFAKRLYALGIRAVYYISPQVWAWGRGRIPVLARVLNRMLVIFPFETGVYAGTGLNVEFVGHPLVDILGELPPVGPREASTLLLLPGSRHSELVRLLPPMLDTVRWFAARHPGFRYVLAAPRSAVAGEAEALLRQCAARAPLPPIELVVGQTHEWLRRATLGLAASGTVTVEAAILGLPLVVAYRVNLFTYLLARLLIDVPFFTMVNLVGGRRIYEEFLQGQVQPGVLGPALEAILPGGRRREEVESGIRDAVAALGGPGRASRRAAAAVLAACGEAGGRGGEA